MFFVIRLHAHLFPSVHCFKGSVKVVVSNDQLEATTHRMLLQTTSLKLGCSAAADLLSIWYYFKLRRCCFKEPLSNRDVTWRRIDLRNFQAGAVSNDQLSGSARPPIHFRLGTASNAVSKQEFLQSTSLMSGCSTAAQSLSERALQCKSQTNSLKPRGNPHFPSKWCFNCSRRVKRVCNHIRTGTTST